MLRRQTHPKSRLKTLVVAASRLSTILGLTLFAFLWLGTFLYLRLDREKSLEAAVDNTRNIARLFEEHVSRAIKEIDQTILFVRRSYERDPEGFDLPGWTATENLLHDLTVQIALIGPDGHLIATNVSRQPQSMDLSDREHFKVHIHSPTDKLFISKPVLGRATNKWTIQLTRRMSKRDGSFGGVIVASLDPYFLSRFFEQVDVGSLGAITLVGTDGIIRARGGLRASELGRSLAETPLFQQLLQQGTGTRIAEGANTKGVRITNFRTMKDFPLAVLVAEAESDVLQGFEERQAVFLATAVALSIVLLTVIGFGILHEMRLLRAQAAQRDSEARERNRSLEMETMLFHIKNGKVLLDPDRNLRIINPGAVEFLGLTEEPKVGAPLPPEADAILASVDTVQPTEFVEITLADDRVVEIARHPMPDGGYLYGINDITQHKRTEAVLADARDRAEAGVRARTSFLATMSHEIRTPLNGVIGMTHLLETCSDDERTSYFKTMRRSAEHLQQIIEDILDVSKLEADRMTFDFLPFNLAETMRAATGMVEAAAQEKGLDLTVEIDPAVPSDLMGDPGRLRQVVLNLVGNAVKFTSSGGVSVRVDAQSAGSSPQLRIRVTDTGIGIAPEDRDRLFHDFSQLDGSITRRFGGTGLGLAISRKLVENMGGEILLDSELGAGTTFTVLLPLTEAIRRERADGSLRPRRVTSDGTGGYNLLLAEDSPTNTLVATKLLEKLGHRVTAVVDGAEAIDALAHDHFDAVFMDVMMPRMDGLTATRLIRRSGQPYANVPIIALTAAALSEDRDEAFAAGVNAFATKPVASDRLRKALQDVLEQEAIAC